jgi:hypothetical protein
MQVFQEDVGFNLGVVEAVHIVRLEETVVVVVDLC